MRGPERADRARRPGSEPAVVVPVNLGCCPDHPRCLLCPPPPSPGPDPDLVAALVEHYRTERAKPGRALRVGFYGGAPPGPELLDAIGGLPFVARVRPDLLTRAGAADLVARGAVGVELDALTFQDAALRTAGRRYRGRVVAEQLEGLRQLGLRAGIVLAPGLPGTDHHQSVQDALRTADMADFARIHPVLVLRGAHLRQAHMDGTYRPLTLGQAITACRAMLDVLEPAGVDVIRVGQSPGPDGLGRAVAGPVHTSLRQLVDARRVLAQLETRLHGVPAGAHIRIRCHPADETHTRGPYNQHIRTLRAAHDLAEVLISPDPALERGQLVIQREGQG